MRPEPPSIGNGRLLAIAAGLFLLNQLIELAFLSWSGHRLLELCRWDCGWYGSMAEHGYDPTPHDAGGVNPRHDANWVFFPAFPLSAMGLHLATGVSGGAAVLLVGRLCFLLATFAFVKLASGEHPGEHPGPQRPLVPHLHPALAAALVTLNPYAIYGNVGYTEPMFLLMSCTFLYHLRRDVLRAGLAGCVLACTRIVGIGAVAPYLVAAAAAWNRPGRSASAWCSACS